MNRPWLVVGGKNLPLWKMMEWVNVSWDDDIPNIWNIYGKSFKIPWFQSPPSSTKICWCLGTPNELAEKTPSTLGRSKGAGTLWRTACNCWSWCCDLHYRWFNSVLFFKWPIEKDDLPIKHGDYMWLSIVFCMFTRPGIIPGRLQLTLWDDPGGHGTDCERLVPLMATARSCIRDVTVKGPIYPAFGVQRVP